MDEFGGYAMSCYYNDLKQHQILKRLETIEEQIVEIGEGRVDSEMVNIAMTMINDMLFRSLQGQDLRSELINLQTVLRSILVRS